MPNYIEKAEMLTLPVVVLKGTVAFPATSINIEENDTSAIATIKTAGESGSYIFFVASKYIKDPPYTESDLFSVGTVAKIKQSLITSEGSMRVIAEGIARASVVSLHTLSHGMVADVVTKTLTLTDTDVKSEAYMREATEALEANVKYLPSSSEDLIMAAKAITDPGTLADFIAANVMIKYEDKQTILEHFEPISRINTLIYLLGKERELLECEMDIHKKVRVRLGQAQKERYLQEQLRVIQEELGEPQNDDDFYNQIIEAKLPKQVEEKLLKENERLAKTPFGAAEAVVLRSYLETCLEIPWNHRSKERIDVKAAKEILDKDHDGLEKVKERVLEYLAVKQLNPEIKSQIICLVGPPGVGKTSIASSLARAMHRKYVRVSLGGIHDESDIRGHRKTYVGAMPGRIITALSEAKVMNPLILLDEIDKVGHEIHGDPASALLEVLDPEQNKSFRDHFVELPIDLSECMFIATANTLETVPKPLIDRMEIIELKSYTRKEKLSIAKNHLLTKQLKRHGLTKKTCRITDGALEDIIAHYTRDAGVRGLEKSIAAICRKCASKIVTGEAVKVTIDVKDLEEYLGPRKLIPEHIHPEDLVGVVNGLAYTEAGGTLLELEAAVLEGSGKLELTGSLGDVMKESAEAAVSYIRSRAADFGIPADFYKNKDIHIHAPEGAIPKDGPSAGVTMMTALVSALTGVKVKRDVAMTGEISLRGRVLAIGGLKEKSMAAYLAGAKQILIPEENKADLDEVDDEVKENVTFFLCKTADDVLAHALVSSPAVAKSAPVSSQKLNIQSADKVNNTDIPSSVPDVTAIRSF